MKKIKQFPLIILMAIFLISCRTSTNKEYPINNLESLKVKKMKIIKQLPLIFLIAIFLISCRTSTNKEYPINNLKKNIEENPNSEKKRMEIKFSCGEDGISEYLDDGWNIIREDSQEKICTWKSVPATKDCNMEKDKGCKITKPDKIGEEKIYLLEK